MEDSYFLDADHYKRSASSKIVDLSHFGDYVPKLSDKYWEDGSGCCYPLYQLNNKYFKRLGAQYYIYKDSMGGMVKYIRAGSRARIVTTHEGKCPILNLGNRQYCLRDGENAGEVMQYGAKAESRLSNRRSLKKTFQTGRDVINFNFAPKDFEEKKALWITLTYAKPTYNYRQIEPDFCAFKKRFERWLDKNDFPSFLYFLAVEAHGDDGFNGWHGWHLHLLLKFDSKAPYIESDLLAELWGNGFVQIKLCTVNDYGEYLSAYVTNAEASDPSHPDAELKSNGKAYTKGTRLFRCPPGMRIFRWSRGFEKPAEQLMSYEEALEQVEAANLTFSQYRVLELGKYTLNYGLEVYTFPSSFESSSQSSRSALQPSDTS